MVLVKYIIPKYNYPCLKHMDWNLSIEKRDRFPATKLSWSLLCCLTFCATLPPNLESNSGAFNVRPLSNLHSWIPVDV